MGTGKDIARVLGWSILELAGISALGKCVGGEENKDPEPPKEVTVDPEARAKQEDRRKRLAGALPDTKAVTRRSREGEWHWSGEGGGAPESEKGNGQMRLECVGMYVTPTFHLGRILYPTDAGTRVTGAIVWNHPEGERQTVQARVLDGEEIVFLDTALKQKLKAERRIWLLLPGHEGENLAWEITLSGSRRAIEAGEQKCQEVYERNAKARRAAARAEVCRKAHQHEAWGAIQMRVEDHLKNPKSADFPFAGFTAFNKTGPCTWSGRSWVEATNSFGGTIRTGFTATATRVQNGWDVRVSFQ